MILLLSLNKRNFIGGNNNTTKDDDSRTDKVRNIIFRNL